MTSIGSQCSSAIWHRMLARRIASAVVYVDDQAGKWVQTDVRDDLIGEILRVHPHVFSYARSLTTVRSSIYCIAPNTSICTLTGQQPHLPSPPTLNVLNNSPILRRHQLNPSDQSDLVNRHAYQFRSMDARTQATTASQRSTVSQSWTW
jgi:hypothetical protein